MRKYVIMGVQGSGKGTQAKMLAADLDLVHISVGDIFRWNVQNHTKLGAQVRRTMAAGELVGDDLVESVVRDRLTQHDWNFGFIIDGFPRNRAAGRVLPGELRHRRRHRARPAGLRGPPPGAQPQAVRRLRHGLQPDRQQPEGPRPVRHRAAGSWSPGKTTPRRRSRSGCGTITRRPTPCWRSSGARSTCSPWTRGPRRRSSSSRSGSASGLPPYEPRQAGEPRAAGA